jgi:hypothetical protein
MDFVKHMKCRPGWSVLLLVVVVGCSGSSSTPSDQEAPVLQGDYLGQTPPGLDPQLFAPGVVSTGLFERDVAMTPDGEEFYFGLLSRNYATIVKTTRTDGGWSDPEIAPFSLDPNVFDLEPHITPDGARFLFLSTRPQEGQEPKSGWAYQDIWVMDRSADGWSEPYNLGPPVNSDAPEYFPSVTRDGTIYFTREVNENGRERSLIFRSRLIDGEYREAEMLPVTVNAGDQQFNAFIDPDERYLIVCMTGRPDAVGRVDYYVSFRSDEDSWIGPVNMGAPINTAGNTGASPYVTSDGRFFFFASTRGESEVEGAEKKSRSYAEYQRLLTTPQNGNSDIYWVDASVIEALRPE